MSDIRSYTREKQKQQLKQKVISNNPKISEDSEEVIEEVFKKRLRRKLITAGLLIVLVAAVIFAWTRYQYVFQYTEYETVWTIPMTESSFAGYVTFGDNIIKYSKDGAAYIDSKGKSIWSVPYQMKSPIAAVNGGFAAIADKQGNMIYICDKTGNVGTITTVLPILKITVSAHGIVTAILDDTTVNSVIAYGKDGTELYEIKTSLAKDGYPLDISISPDGTQLISSYVYVDNRVLQNRVSFHNFDLGKNNINRLVGLFKDYGATMIPQVCFMNETYACAFGSNSLSFFSLRNVLEPERVQLYPIENEIKSVFYSKSYVGIILNSNEGDAAYTLHVYSSAGDKLFSKPIDFEYTQAEFNGDMILLYNEETCRLYNMSGVQKFTGSFDFSVSKIVCGNSPNTLILTGTQAMKEIKLK